MKSTLLATMLAVSIVIPALAASHVAIQEGRNYKVIEQSQVVPSKQVEVVEFFSFACPHCAHLEPTIQEWKKNLPKGVVFRRVPVVFRLQWENLAKAYYVLTALKLPQLESEVFKAIHEQNRDLSNPDTFVKWLGEHGVDMQKARMLYDSFTVNTEVAQAKVIARKYNVEGVPFLMVDGHYTTDVGMAGGPDKLPGVLNQLIEMARQKHTAK